MKPRPDRAEAGQESVWAYPRPAIAEPTCRRLRIVHRGVVVADTVKGIRTLETSHPPTYYFPREDVNPSVLQPADHRSFCEWKGWAAYYDVELAGERARAAAWSYPAPSADFRLLKDHVAFYAAPFDACTVDGEQVAPRPAASMAVGSPPARRVRSRACPVAASGDRGAPAWPRRALALALQLRIVALIVAGGGLA